MLIACHAWFRDQIGGSQKIATDLAEYLAAQGRRVCYVCGAPGPRPENPTIERGVEVWRYPLPKARSPHPANLLGHVLGTYRLARRILRTGRVACVNGHTPLQFLGASLAAGRRCACRVYSVHSPFAEELEAGWTGGPRRLRQRIARAAARGIESVNCRRATRVQVYSRFTASLIEKHHGPKVAAKTAVSPGWVDVDRFRPIDDPQAARSRLGGPWATRGPVFLSVRRLEARMGLDDLVQAAALLRGQGFSFRLLIGGSGPLAETLRREICEARLEDTVFLLGRIPEADLPLCYAAADCFVLPTRALECFGLIILESYACGVPVIATPVGAIPELVERHGREWLAAGTDSKAIADRMGAFLRRELAADPGRPRALAEEYRAECGLESLTRLLLPAHVQT